MTPEGRPVNLSAGLTTLRLQLAAAFTPSPAPAPVSDPIRFETVDAFGRAAKEDLQRFSARP